MSPESFSLSRDTLNPEVSSYAQNLEAQIKVIYQQFGAHTWEEFQRLAQSPKSPIPLETLDKLHNLLQQLDYIRKEGKVPETETCFIVQNARNLFRDALIAGGIPDTDPCTAEHKDIEVNLETILVADIASYRATGAQGLEHWAQALEVVQGDIRLTPEKRRIIEQEIEDGAIIIFMPGRQAQLQTTPEQYKIGFLPIWIKDDTPQTLKETSLWDHLEALIRSKDTSLVQDIPERPYIILVKPTAKVDPRTTNKTVDEQKQELVIINQERASQGQSKVHASTPESWGALTRRFTEIVKTSASQPLTTLTPIDDVNNSYCRFIGLPLSTGGGVPDGSVNPGSRQVRFDRGDARDGYPLAGFRLEVRVEV